MRAVPYDERIRRAQALLDEARQVSLAGEGQRRGAALRHKRSLLLNARRALGRLNARRPPSTATPAQIAAARRLAQQIDDEPAPLLEDLRRHPRR